MSKLELVRFSDDRATRRDDVRRGFIRLFSARMTLVDERKLMTLGRTDGCFVRYGEVLECVQHVSANAGISNYYLEASEHTADVILSTRRSLVYSMAKALWEDQEPA